MLSHPTLVPLFMQHLCMLVLQDIFCRNTGLLAIGSGRIWSSQVLASISSVPCLRAHLLWAPHGTSMWELGLD